jgi:hypothetical protein
MPNTRTLPHTSEWLGGVSQPSHHGSDRPPATQPSAHRLVQWLPLARPAAWIGRENGPKVTASAAMHATREHRTSWPCTHNQTS